MSSKKVQEHFGEVMVNAIREFAKTDIKSVNDLSNDEFSHIDNTDLKRALSETLYGTRWLYKLGLAALTDNIEQAAHIRNQVIDYASICEGILADIIHYGYINGKLIGDQKDFFDMKKANPLRWNTHDPFKTIERTVFEWRIQVAKESGIIDTVLASELDVLRKNRNNVHLTLKISLGHSYYVSMAKKAYTALHKTIEQTKHWKSTN